MILSASRRTDIPAFYSEWFMNRITEGFVLARNPMNHKQISRIRLSPDVIDCIVFWTKDPENMIDKLPKLEDLGYHYYFQFTLTPYEADIERKVRNKKDIIVTFQQLSSLLGSNRVIWRYDPIILNHDINVEYHISKFQELCQELEGYTNVCIISFVDLYYKLNSKLKNQYLRVITDSEMLELSSAFVETGLKYGIELQACCEKPEIYKTGLIPTSCINRNLIQNLTGGIFPDRKDRNQREGCRCMQSVDIGVYNTCGHGCIYCYANFGETSIERNRMRHDPKSALLLGKVEEGSWIIERRS